MGRFVLRSDKRSSENGVQTTFGVGGKGSSLEKPRVCVGGFDAGYTCYTRIPSFA